jgi:peptidoglycan/xylan/chitin deacetylase (PgdA/CDA1 family)
MSQRPVFITVDVEPDCPPFLKTWRGIDEGMPKLCRLLDEEQVRATMFVTGDVARRYPAMIDRLVADGHELGCHGDTHASFATLTPEQSEREIVDATRTLRAHGDVVSFRAPYLRLPVRTLTQLRLAGYRLDSSAGRHKTLSARVEVVDGMLRVPASITSSTLRWPAALRNPLLAVLSKPAVVFVHPWEFVDLRRTSLRFDCRFKTGDTALACLRDTIRFFRNRSAVFGTMRECLTTMACRL